MNKKIFFVFFFAFIIRLIALNQSLWLDEAVTAKVVMNYGFTEIVSKFSPTDFHPPLYYLFMKLWTNMFGYSEVALRMPSVLFSLMTGYVVYLIGGIWAASFFLFNPLIVYYSQEARMYMMATLFLTGALYYLLKNLRVNELPSFKLKNQIIFCLLISRLIEFKFIAIINLCFRLLILFTFNLDYFTALYLHVVLKEIDKPYL